MSDESDSITDETLHASSDSSSYSDCSDISISSEPIEPIIINNIMKQLRAQVTIEKFRRLDIHGKLSNIERMLNNYESLLTVEPMRIPKSNVESLKYEMDGDVALDNWNNDVVLYLYNKSIAFAEKDYQHMYRLYEKRALMLCEKKLFKASVHSFELAIKCCPSDSEQDYTRRIENIMLKYTSSLSIEERIRSECKSDINSLTTLINDRKHSNVPFLANCLELTDIENYGRGITTNCDLNPGDVVAIEKAYASILYSSAQYRHCSSCLKENWSLIPCPHCTTVMYCNQKCLQIAWQKFHKHECKISNYLMEILPDMTMFRVPLQTIELFGGIDPLIEFEETSRQTDIRSFSVFNVNHENIQYDDDGEIVNYPDNENFNSKMTPFNYHPVHGLIRDVPELPNWQIYTQLRSAIITCLIYRLFRNIFNITTDNQKRFVETFIYRHVRAARIYNYELNTAREIRVDIHYATALYPFAALINHSCEPNLIFVNNGSSMTMIVLHPIKRGEQLFFYYGYHYMSHEKLERQERLELQWNFTCQCTACTEEYPQLHGLGTHCIPFEPNDVAFRPRTDLKFRNLIEVIRTLFTFRLSHLRFYPSSDICYYEAYVTNYLSQLLRRFYHSASMNC